MKKLLAATIAVSVLLQSCESKYQKALISTPKVAPELCDASSKLLTTKPDVNSVDLPAIFDVLQEKPFLTGRKFVNQKNLIGKTWFCKDGRTLTIWVFFQGDREILFEYFITPIIGSYQN